MSLRPFSSFKTWEGQGKNLLFAFDLFVFIFIFSFLSIFFFFLLHLFLIFVFLSFLYCFFFYAFLFRFNTFIFVLIVILIHSSVSDLKYLSTSFLAIYCTFFEIIHCFVYLDSYCASRSKGARQQQCS